MNARGSNRRRGGWRAVAVAAPVVLVATTMVACGSSTAAVGTDASGVVQAAAAAPPGPGSMTMEQTLSDGAQRTTIAFDALGFLTGNLGTDSFFPPGKVADFWGFQYLRDNDPSEMGHNTDFLTKASLNMLTVLTADQRAALIALAKNQVTSINDYGYQRFVLMTAFRRLVNGDLPTGTTGLSESAVKAFSADLYRLDGQISYQRAAVMGPILAGLSDEQKAYLAGMVGKGMTSWPTVDEPTELRALSHDEKVAVMTYAGDMFSWYAGNVTADVYFCPERQGTYFGSFYLKDAPAVGNPGYSIGTNITADMGNALLAALTPAQAQLVTSLVDTQRPALTGIVDVRTQVSTELRKYMAGQASDSSTVSTLMGQYGEYDGTIVYNLATNFAAVSKSLTAAQKATLLGLRHQTLGDFAPTAAFLYATPIDFPTVRNTDFLFGTGTVPTPVTTLPAATSTIAANRARVKTSAHVTIGGRTSLGVAGTKVKLLNNKGRVVATVTTTAKGKWKAVIHPALGLWSYRLRIPATSTTSVGYSDYVKVRGIR
ncbi:MAG: hypothetical protein WCP28_17640 [Actinomycetes bacterium]